jgi:hypothetical protein
MPLIPTYDLDCSGKRGPRMVPFVNGTYYLKRDADAQLASFVKTTRAMIEEREKRIAELEQKLEECRKHAKS